MMFIICTNTCFNHIPLRFVHGVSYSLHCILPEKCRRNSIHFNMSLIELL